MFVLVSAQQVTTGSLAPPDQSQRHGCTARTDDHSWNQAVQRMEYILTGLTSAAGVTGCSAGGWANAGAQGRPRGCAEPASSRAGPVARASRPPPRRQAAARRRGEGGVDSEERDDGRPTRRALTPAPDAVRDE